jgi:Zn-dependent membrane protease YugP
MIVILLFFMGVGYFVQWQLKKRFTRYGEVFLPSGLTGRQIAERMLADHGIYDVRVISVPGSLSDHYNPADKTVNLSPEVYSGQSVSAAAVAAHECGHAVQHATAYAWLNMRSKMVPMVNFSSQIMNALFLLSILGVAAFGLNYGLMIQVIIAAQAVLTVFALITLPVEYDASNRALVWLERTSITVGMQQDQAKDALKWAARTYLVAAIASVTQLVYYIMLYMGRSDD